MMGLPRTLLAALLLLVAGPVFAQGAYPTKQVRMVVPSITNAVAARNRRPAVTCYNGLWRKRLLL